MIRYPHQICTVLLLALFAPAFTGCTQLSMKLRRVPTESKKDPVTEVLCLWEATSGNRPDGMPARGFQGQVMFFTRNKRTPVRVNGTVVIEQFVSEPGHPHSEEPLHTFRFDAKAWAAHMAAGTLGPTYNVFVPLMKDGTARESCGLRVRLLREKLPSVQSDVARVILESEAPLEGETNRGTPARAKRIIQVSHDSTENRKLRATTIRPGAPPKQVNSGAGDTASLDQARVASLRSRLDKLRRKRERECPSSSRPGLDLTR